MSGHDNHLGPVEATNVWRNSLWLPRDIEAPTSGSPRRCFSDLPPCRRAEPGGWNRIIINVDDLTAEVARLREAQLHFRNNIVQGPGGSEIILDDPSGNPIELFQPAP